MLGFRLEEGQVSLDPEDSELSNVCPAKAESAKLFMDDDDDDVDR